MGGGGRTLGDSNEISLVECFLRATSPDACRNFLVTARFFRFHRDCGKIEIWCWEWQGWNIPMFDLRSGLGLRSSGFAFFFFFFFIFERPGSRPMRSNRNLTFDRQRRRNINGTNWPVYYILCLVFFPFFLFFVLFFFVLCKRKKKKDLQACQILYNSWKRLPFRLD